MLARPIVFASVPNQIVRVGLWNIRWRIVPPPLFDTGVTEKNDSVFGSNPTRRLGCTPVSASQMRSLSSEAIAYGNDIPPAGIGHSFILPVFGSSRPSFDCV